MNKKIKILPKATPVSGHQSKAMIDLEKHKNKKIDFQKEIIFKKKYIENSFFSNKTNLKYTLMISKV